MKYLISLLLILANTFRLSACDCPPIETYQQRIESINNVDLVVLAELINTNEKTNQSTFKVLETFKGKSFEKVIAVDQGNCSITSFENGIWLLYGDYIQDNQIDVSLCNATRSLSSNRMLASPPPPYANFYDSLQHNLYTLEKGHEELKGFLNDIELLRYQKTQSDLKSDDKTLHYLLFVMIFINIF